MEIQQTPVLLMPLVALARFLARSTSESIKSGFISNQIRVQRFMKVAEGMDGLEKARSLLSSGQLQESCELFTHFIHSHKDSIEHRAAVTDAYNSRGHVKYLSVDFPGAIKDYSQAIQRDPDFTIAWYNRGQVQYRLGESGPSS